MQSSIRQPSVLYKSSKKQCNERMAYQLGAQIQDMVTDLSNIDSAEEIFERIQEQLMK